ncbi:auxin-responsive protein IAA32-like isoform X1 [Cannabis sativa]|uniref:auxin-responsive protein IAA32-like isoform X1 n=1 Tax=Cannabis sativa TaxID=3483 RepID=UPI0029C9DF4F|nr:auxin-responsive protein IAA32-like isoform X1 [Cannabis sativa]
MDSNSSSFLLNPSTLQSVYYHHQAKEGHDGVIDLGLSLRTLQPEAYNHHPSAAHLVSLEGYDDLLEWPQSNLNLKCSNINNTQQPNKNNFQEDCEEEGEGIQSKERWVYVKVNMDGVIVGRKVCILDHGSYSSLALQLEDMFGRQTVSGLRLFQDRSEFTLFYKDRYENWRSVGDIPWKYVYCKFIPLILFKNCVFTNYYRQNYNFDLIGLKSLIL